MLEPNLSATFAASKPNILEKHFDVLGGGFETRTTEF